MTAVSSNQAVAQSTAKPVRARKMLVVAVSALALLGSMQPARASCSVGVIPKDVFSSVGSLSMDVATAGTAIAVALAQLSDAITRYANNTTQSASARNAARAAQADARSAQTVALALGTGRAQAFQEYKPSVSACREVSAQQRLGSTGVQYASMRTQMQTKNTAYSNNAPGSGAERGTLQGLSTIWNERCSRYANPTTMQAGPGCAGPADPAMRDLDIQPWKALLDPVQYSNADRVQAASDSIRMLTELAPPDPVRGAALSRTEGKNLHVLRMRDVTRMNLVRGVLEDIAAMRTADTASGQTHSRLARFEELVTGQKFDTATGTLTGTPADMTDTSVSEDSENGSMQMLASRLATSLGLKFETNRLMEQIVAMEAVDLAIKVESARSQGATSAAISLKRD